MFFSGGISALAGFTETAGVINRLQHSLSPGYGYTAIIIAWLSGQNAIGLLFHPSLWPFFLLQGTLCSLIINFPSLL